MRSIKIKVYFIHIKMINTVTLVMISIFKLFFTQIDTMFFQSYDTIIEINFHNYTYSGSQSKRNQTTLLVHHRTWMSFLLNCEVVDLISRQKISFMLRHLNSKPLSYYWSAYFHSSSSGKYWRSFEFLLPKISFYARNASMPAGKLLAQLIIWNLIAECEQIPRTF